MRKADIILIVALLGGCATEAPEVPLLQVCASDAELAREEAAAVREAGVPVKLVAIADMQRDEIPAWVDVEKGGWVLVGRASDRQRAEQAIDAWIARWKESSPSPRPAPQPLALGRRHELEGEEIAKIRGELARRRITDQAVRTDPRRRAEMPRVDAENTAWLEGVVTDVGWIDVERFGQPAADAAFLIVQHSGKLSLMLAALPEIEGDVQAGRADAQNYALLYDRTQLMSGGKQRYGSQIGQNEAGELVVSNLEDPDRVEEFRAELGLMPLRDYLKLFGREVRIER